MTKHYTRWDLLTFIRAMERIGVFPEGHLITDDFLDLGNLL